MCIVACRLASLDRGRPLNLQNLSAEAFSKELDRRIADVNEAWKAVKLAFGGRLERLAESRLPLGVHEHDRLWAEMESSERALEEGWRELERRKDLRLGR